MKTVIARPWTQPRVTNRKHIQTSLGATHKHHALTSLSPLDGRYHRQTDSLRDIVSEYGLIKRRVEVEIKWFQHLSLNVTDIKDFPPLTNDAIDFTTSLHHNFSLDDAEEIKNIEKITNHDVKAIEYWIKKKFEQSNIQELTQFLEYVHFGCTSEDINNLCHGLMLKEAIQNALLPPMDSIITSISNLALAYADVPMLSRTHGQAASPTTMGKEMAVFAYRLRQQLDHINSVVIKGKLAGAVGNYNAHIVTHPNIDWTNVANDFVTSLGLVHNPYVTQIEPHDYISELFDSIIRFNNILMEFNKDIWGYISLGYFKQKVIEGEVGSSTMPHKVNPIDFENSEGNLGIANAVFNHMSNKLLISRWQRDLTDSTVLRNLGVGLGYSLVAYTSALKGISKLTVDKNKMMEDLEVSWEVLAEPIQMVMRKYGVQNSYEILKSFTRGNPKVTKEALQQLIASLPTLSPEAKKDLFDLTPWTYVGNATEQAQNIAKYL